MSRWETKRLGGDERPRRPADAGVPESNAVRAVRQLAAEVFASPERAETWLASPNAELGDVRPIDASRTTAGRKKVVAVLNRFAHGVFS